MLLQHNMINHKLAYLISRRNRAVYQIFLNQYFFFYFSKSYICLFLGLHFIYLHSKKNLCFTVPMYCVMKEFSMLFFYGVLPIFWILHCIVWCFRVEGNVLVNFCLDIIHFWCVCVCVYIHAYKTLISFFYFIFSGVLICGGPDLKKAFKASVLINIHNIHEL